MPFDSWVPTVAASGRNVSVAWVDTRDGNEEEYFRRSRDDCLIWEPAVRLIENGANSWAPSIAAAGDTVHFVWFDQKDSPAQPIDAERKLDQGLRLMGLTHSPGSQEGLPKAYAESGSKVLLPPVKLVGDPSVVVTAVDAERHRLPPVDESEQREGEGIVRVSTPRTAEVGLMAVVHRSLGDQLTDKLLCDPASEEVFRAHARVS